MIRQHLMCTADIGVLGQVWWRDSETGKPHPFPDFNNKHTCKNFEDIQRWYGGRQMPEETPEDFLLPPADIDSIPVGVP